jgi:enoyl-CoA hydratase
MDFQTIRAELIADKVALLTLNRPEKKNAISIAMRYEISSCLKNWQDSSEVGIVIIAGAGGAFSAGFDLKEFGQKDLSEEIFKSSSQYHRAVWNFPKPIMAAVENHAFAGGFDLTTLCDIRICSEGAVFGHPEIKFGAPPLFTPLRWIIGNGMARDLCLTGRTIGSQEAYRLGLVSEVVKDQTLIERATQIAKTILEAPVATLMTVKKYLVSDSGLSFEESFVNEHDIPFQSFLLKK